MSSLYHLELVDRARHPRFAGSVTGATHSSDRANLSCGDEVHWEIRVQDDRIVEVRHTCRACAVCIASADLLAEAVEGQPFPECLHRSPHEHLDRLGIELSPVRQKCALLPLEALAQLQSA